MTKLAAVLLGVAMGISPLASAANEVDPRGPEAQAEALQSWREKIANASNLPSDEAIPLLAACVYKTSMRNIFQSDERWEVHFAAQKALVAIPGHAEFYAKKLEDARRKVDEAEGLKKGMERSNLLREQMVAFDKLGLMPSAETVRVLGEYLFDERGRNPDAKPGEKYGLEEIGESPNSALAVRAIARLPLVSRPVQTPWDKAKYWEDLEPWKLWYEQVKAGTRTFRFKDDPQEYSLAGPVSEAHEPKLVDQAAVSKAAPESSVVAEKEPSSLPIWPLTLVGVLLVAAIWSETKRRPAAS